MWCQLDNPQGEVHPVHKADPELENVPFLCSSGWLDSVLKRHGLSLLKMHGEGNEMSPEEKAAIMGPWLVKFHELLVLYEISPNCCYNGDQTGLYYRKLPNTLYVNKEEKKKSVGAKV